MIIGDRGSHDLRKGAEYEALVMSSRDLVIRKSFALLEIFYKIFH